MQEDALLIGPLEPTIEPYAVAKIAGIKLSKSYNRQNGVDYRSITPTNFSRPGDSFHPLNSHVPPTLIRRFHEAALTDAKEIVIWGTGTPVREFLHVDDMAAASTFVMELPVETYRRETDKMMSHINVGSGTDVTVREFAETVAETTGYTGALTFDATKPDCAPRKLMDVSRVERLGWAYSVGLKDGIQNTYDWYLTQTEAQLRSK